MNRLAFGYSSQQYGNNNNERKIDQLKKDNQTLAQEINNYKATITSIEEENRKNLAEKKDLKKQMKKLQVKRDKVKNDLYVAIDELNELKSAENEMNKLQTQISNIDQQRSEIIVENDIKSKKIELDKNESELRIAKMSQIELKQLKDENKLVQRVKEVETDLTIIRANNNAIESELKSDGYTKTREYFGQLYKDQLTEKEKAKLLMYKQQEQDE